MVSKLKYVSGFYSRGFDLQKYAAVSNKALSCSSGFAKVVRCYSTRSGLRLNLVSSAPQTNAVLEIKADSRISRARKRLLEASELHHHAATGD